METITVSVAKRDHSQLKLSEGRVINKCRSNLDDELEIDLCELPGSRMPLERQSEIVMMCLKCEKTGKWSDFEPLARKFLMEQLGLEPAEKVVAEIPSHDE